MPIELLFNGERHRHRSAKNIWFDKVKFLLPNYLLNDGILESHFDILTVNFLDAHHCSIDRSVTSVVCDSARHYEQQKDDKTALETSRSHCIVS